VTFLQIMRDVYLARRSGVSVQVALMTACRSDDDWEVIYNKLAQAARLEQALKKFKPGARR